MRNAGRWKVAAVAILFLSLAVSSARSADDSYFDISLEHLTITQGTLPKPNGNIGSPYFMLEQLRQPYAVLDGPGEVFAFSGVDDRAAADPVSHLVIHTPAAGDVTGRLYLKNEAGTGMVVLRFKVPASDAKPESKEIFYRQMKIHYEGLMSDGMAGAAWFRHRANEAGKALGEKPDDAQAFSGRPSTLDDTYSLFSGNEALAENLQLDRALPRGADKPGWKEVGVNSIEGITVSKMDWTNYNKGKSPTLDLLAKSIPADQPAIFVADFPSLIALADEADHYGTPVLQYTEPQSQDARTRERYEKQLGFSLNALGRLMGPALISSIAITGSDPYLRSGGDIAILFEPKDANALKALVSAQMALARQMAVGATAVAGKLENLDYTGSSTPDRALSSYMAQLSGGTLLITNSLAELSRLAAVDAGKSPALSTVPEYTFFRDRYRRGDAEESALVILSDATIRRWCGPQYRIADSRRTRAAAVLAELNANYLDALVTGKQETALIAGDYAVPNLGNLRLTPNGATSSTYGSLDFLTPISELKLDTVTEAEADAYKRWRDSYETNWRGMFDPIAIRLGVHEKKMSADVTVMPLIWGNDYRPMIDIVSGAKLNAASADLHGALMLAGMAINMKSPEIQSYTATASLVAPTLKIDSFGWIGQSIWLYADDDPFWTELAKAEKPDEFFQANWQRLPVALNIEVSNGFKLAAFRVAIHGFIEQSAPGMTVWQNVTYKDQPYLKIVPSEQAKGQNADLKNAAIYYRATGDSLLITPNETLLQRAIDRQLARDAAKKDGKPVAADDHPILGESVVLQADRKLFEIYEHSLNDYFQANMQRRSWSNLPILNEWKRRYPDQNPLKIYEQFFHARLIDPAGGTYSWNDKWQTMESSIYGSPAEPKTGPAGISALVGLLRANFGVTFEPDGLRAKVDVDRTGK